MYLLLKCRVLRATTFVSLWRFKLFCFSAAQIAGASPDDCLLLALSSFEPGESLKWFKPETLTHISETRRDN